MSETKYVDKTIKCIEKGCGAEFVFTAGEQEFFASKDPPFAEPKRCKTCRERRKASGANAGR